MSTLLTLIVSNNESKQFTKASRDTGVDRQT
jgi:hypothetical protein